MALVEYYIGTRGPYFIDDTDPLFTASGQMATKGDVSDGIVSPSNSVESSTSFGQSAAAGTSDDYSRSDHKHGTPANPLAGGQTTNVTIDSVTLHFTNGLLTSVS